MKSSQWIRLKREFLRIILHNDSLIKLFWNMTKPCQSSITINDTVYICTFWSEKRIVPLLLFIYYYLLYDFKKSGNKMPSLCEHFAWIWKVISGRIVVTLRHVSQASDWKKPTIYRNLYENMSFAQRCSAKPKGSNCLFEKSALLTFGFARMCYWD